MVGAVVNYYVAQVVVVVLRAWGYRRGRQRSVGGRCEVGTRWDSGQRGESERRDTNLRPAALQYDDMMFFLFGSFLLFRLSEVTAVCLC